MMLTPRTAGPRKLPVRQGSPEWLAARRTHITATDMAAIEGVSPWKAEQDIHDEKETGEAQESTLVMQVGLALENLIAAQYARQTGNRVRRVHGLWESRQIPWAAASPDATAGPILVELKWSGNRSRFAGDLPEDVEVQARWQAMVAEVDVVDVAALTVGDEEVRIWTVRRDPTIEDYLIGKAEDFWLRHHAGGPFAQSERSIKRKYPADDGSALDADADVAAAVRALWDVRSRIELLEEDEKALKVAIQTRMADAAVLTGVTTEDGKPLRVTWKRTKDRTETDWKSLASGLLAPMPETERAALVGLHSRVVEGFRPFRLTVGKEEAS